MYLHSKDTETQTGVIHIHIVYGLDEDENGINSPVSAGYFEDTVNLPYCGQIKNPLYCEKAADYLIKEWLKYPAFWSMAGVKLLQDGMGRNTIVASNMLAEVIFKHDKAKPDMSFHCSEPGTYVNHAWQESNKAMQFFSKQEESAHHIINRRRKKKSNAEKKAVAPTSDAIENDRINKIGSEWGTGKLTHKDEIRVARLMEKVFSKMGLKSSEKKRDALIKFHEEERVGSMAKMADVSFHKYLTEQRPPATRISNGNMELFEKFVKKKYQLYGLDY